MSHLRPQLFAGLLCRHGDAGTENIHTIGDMEGFMIGTAREVISEMLKHSDLDSKRFVFATWDRDDIRSTCLDWDLSDDELDETLRRVNINLECGGDIGQIHQIVNEILDERRSKRTVEIPASSLEIIMELAEKEIKRLTDQVEQEGGNKTQILNNERGVIDSLRDVLNT